MALDIEVETNNSSRPSAEAMAKSRELGLVLNKLKDVDQILEHLAVFWAQTEVRTSLSFPPSHPPTHLPPTSSTA